MDAQLAAADPQQGDDGLDLAVAHQPALPLGQGMAQPVRAAHQAPANPAPVESRALVLSDFVPPKSDLPDRLIRFAYRLGLDGAMLSAPFRKPARPRLLATVESPLAGDRTVGMALRAGHFLVHGLKVPIAEVDYESSSRLAPPFERVIHGFGWLRDLAAAGPREQGIDTAERICKLWLAANPRPGKCAAWQVEHVAQRLMAWLVQAPLVLSGRDESLRPSLLAALDETARWLDREVRRTADPLGAVLGWGAVTAAGLLLPQGKPRRLYGEAGLIAALGDLVGEDGGALS
ncbi:MAG TPA: heparinase, partial [Erythrobacter sp.]|nr:heparinase [Erythrobacter sp.]